MTLAPGSRLGPYEIVAPVGAGGMGEVWKGRDTRLDREVAIKVLPPAFARNAELRARFEREARTISSLNHPHICTLHDVGHEGDTHFLVMELIDGETLAERLEKGPLPLDQVLEVGAQVACALACAHRQGIVHRDLKPGNVMLTREGAKLLDFGLARTAAGSAPVRIETEMPTEAAPLTAEGTILGTFQYMAPEQLEGKKADERTDVFAFGALLYEMATGRRAFQGESKTRLIAAIVSSQPAPISEIVPLAPPALEQVVRRCLEKDPDDRWQSAHDVAVQLRWIADAGSQAGAGAAVTGRRKTREWLAWSLAFAAALAAAGASWLRPSPDPPATLHLSVPTRTADYVDAGDGYISPDGDKVLIWVRKGEGGWLWAVRDLGSGAVTFLEGTGGVAASFLCWSPDGSEIAVIQEQRLKAIDVERGSVRDLGASTVRWSLGGSWSRDNVIIYAAGGAVVRLSGLGGPSEPVTTIDPDRYEAFFLGPVFLPDGNRFLFTVRIMDPAREKATYKLRAGALDSPETSEIGDVGSAVALLDSGHLVHVVDSTLTARPFDPGTLRFTGRPIAIADGVFRFGRGITKFSAARNGTILYRKRELSESMLWFDARGDRLGALVESGGFDWVDVSLDGHHAAVEVADPRTGNTDVWLYGLERSATRRLTRHLGWEGSPVWTPDGNAIVFSAGWKRPVDIYIQDLEGSGEARLVLGTEEAELVSDVSPDGRHVAYRTMGPARNWDLWLTPIDDSAAATVLVAAAGDQTIAKFSPDGSLIAYTSDETGRSEIWIRPFPSAGRSLQISTEGGTAPAWATDELTLFYARGRGIYGVDLSTPAKRARPQPELRLETPNPIVMFDVAPDGRFLVILRDDSIVEPNHVIVNWRPPQG